MRPVDNFLPCRSNIAVGVTIIVGTIGGIYLLSKGAQYLSQLTEKKSRPKRNKTCNVCFTSLDLEDIKSCITCCNCHKHVCRGNQCSIWLPSQAGWECQLCSLSSESHSRASEWIHQQITDKFLRPMSTRSDLTLPTKEHNADYDARSEAPSSICGDQKEKVREFVEDVLANMLGGSLDNVSVGQVSTNIDYLPLYETEDCPGVSHIKLKRLIEKIIQDILRLPTVIDYSGVQERSDESLPYFDPKKYQELLATAVLNKIVDSYNYEKKFENNPDDTIKAIELDRNHNASKTRKIERRQSSSSVEPRSDSSIGDTAAAINRGDDLSLSDSDPIYISDVQGSGIQTGDESVLSDYIARHRVPFPDLSVPNDFTDDDITSVAGSNNNEGTWEDNWLFKKKKHGTDSSVSVGMLVPSPKEDIKTLIGDKTADEMSDLSDFEEDTDDLKNANIEIDLQNVRIQNKSVIGGKSTIGIFDELLDQTSLISTTSIPEGESMYIEAKNEHILTDDGFSEMERPIINLNRKTNGIPKENEAINSLVTTDILQCNVPNQLRSFESSDEPPVIPPPMNYIDHEENKTLSATIEIINIETPSEPEVICATSGDGSSSSTAQSNACEDNDLCTTNNNTNTNPIMREDSSIEISMPLSTIEEEEDSNRDSITILDNEDNEYEHNRRPSSSFMRSEIPLETIKATVHARRDSAILFLAAAALTPVLVLSTTIADDDLNNVTRIPILNESSDVVTENQEEECTSGESTLITQLSLKQFENNGDVSPRSSSYETAEDDLISRREGSNNDLSINQDIEELGFEIVPPPPVGEVLIIEIVPPPPSFLCSNEGTIEECETNISELVIPVIELSSIDPLSEIEPPSNISLELSSDMEKISEMEILATSNRDMGVNEETNNTSIVGDCLPTKSSEDLNQEILDGDGLISTEEQNSPVLDTKEVSSINEQNDQPISEIHLSSNAEIQIESSQEEVTSDATDVQKKVQSDHINEDETYSTALSIDQQLEPACVEEIYPIRSSDIIIKSECYNVAEISAEITSNSEVVQCELNEEKIDICEEPNIIEETVNGNDLNPVDIGPPVECVNTYCQSSQTLHETEEIPKPSEETGNTNFANVINLTDKPIDLVGPQENIGTILDTEDIPKTECPSQINSDNVEGIIENTAKDDEILNSPSAECETKCEDKLHSEVSNETSRPKIHDNCEMTGSVSEGDEEITDQFAEITSDTLGSGTSNIEVKATIVEVNSFEVKLDTFTEEIPAPLITQEINIETQSKESTKLPQKSDDAQKLNTDGINLPKVIVESAKSCAGEEDSTILNSEEKTANIEISDSDQLETPILVESCETIEEEKIKLEAIEEQNPILGDDCTESKLEELPPRVVQQVVIEDDLKPDPNEFKEECVESILPEIASSEEKRAEIEFINSPQDGIPITLESCNPPSDGDTLVQEKMANIEISDSAQSETLILVESCEQIEEKKIEVKPVEEQNPIIGDDCTEFKLEELPPKVVQASVIEDDLKSDPNDITFSEFKEECTESILPEISSSKEKTAEIEFINSPQVDIPIASEIFSPPSDGDTLVHEKTESKAVDEENQMNIKGDEIKHENIPEFDDMLYIVPPPPIGEELIIQIVPPPTIFDGSLDEDEVFCLSEEADKIAPEIILNNSTVDEVLSANESGNVDVAGITLVENIKDAKLSGFETVSEQVGYSPIEITHFTQSLNSEHVENLNTMQSNEASQIGTPLNDIDENINKMSSSGDGNGDAVEQLTEIKMETISSTESDLKDLIIENTQLEITSTELVSPEYEDSNRNPSQLSSTEETIFETQKNYIPIQENIVSETFENRNQENEEFSEYNLKNEEVNISSNEPLVEENIVEIELPNTTKVCQPIESEGISQLEDKNMDSGTIELKSEEIQENNETLISEPALITEQVMGITEPTNECDNETINEFSIEDASVNLFIEPPVFSIDFVGYEYPGNVARIIDNIQEVRSPFESIPSENQPVYGIAANSVKINLDLVPEECFQSFTESANNTPFMSLDVPDIYSDALLDAAFDIENEDEILSAIEEAVTCLDAVITNAVKEIDLSVTDADNNSQIDEVSDILENESTEIRDDFDENEIKDDVFDTDDTTNILALEKPELETIIHEKLFETLSDTLAQPEIELVASIEEVLICEPEVIENVLIGNLEHIEHTTEDILNDDLTTEKVSESQISVQGHAAKVILKVLNCKISEDIFDEQQLVESKELGITSGPNEENVEILLAPAEFLYIPVEEMEDHVINTETPLEVKSEEVSVAEVPQVSDDEKNVEIIVPNNTIINLALCTEEFSKPVDGIEGDENELADVVVADTSSNAENIHGVEPLAEIEYLVVGEVNTSNTSSEANISEHTTEKTESTVDSPEIEFIENVIKENEKIDIVSSTSEEGDASSTPEFNETASIPEIITLDTQSGNETICLLQNPKEKNTNCEILTSEVEQATPLNEDVIDHAIEEIIETETVPTVQVDSIITIQPQPVSEIAIRDASVVFPSTSPILENNIKTATSNIQDVEYTEEGNISTGENTDELTVCVTVDNQLVNPEKLPLHSSEALKASINEGDIPSVELDIVNEADEINIENIAEEKRNDNALTGQLEEPIPISSENELINSIPAPIIFSDEGSASKALTIEDETPNLGNSEEDKINEIVVTNIPIEGFEIIDQEIEKNEEQIDDLKKENSSELDLNEQNTLTCPSEVVQKCEIVASSTSEKLSEEIIVDIVEEDKTEQPEVLPMIFEVPIEFSLSSSISEDRTINSEDVGATTVSELYINIEEINVISAENTEALNLCDSLGNQEKPVPATVEEVKEPINEGVSTSIESEVQNVLKEEIIESNTQEIGTEITLTPVVGEPVPVTSENELIDSIPAPIVFSDEVSADKEFTIENGTQNLGIAKEDRITEIVVFKESEIVDQEIEKISDVMENVEELSTTPAETTILNSIKNEEKIDDDNGQTTVICLSEVIQKSEIVDNSSSEKFSEEAIIDIEKVDNTELPEVLPIITVPPSVIQEVSDKLLSSNLISEDENINLVEEVGEIKITELNTLDIDRSEETIVGTEENTEAFKICDNFSDQLVIQEDESCSINEDVKELINDVVLTSTETKVETMVKEINTEINIQEVAIEVNLSRTIDEPVVINSEDEFLNSIPAPTIFCDEGNANNIENETANSGSIDGNFIPQMVIYNEANAKSKIVHGKIEEIVEVNKNFEELSTTPSEGTLLNKNTNEEQIDDVKEEATQKSESVDNSASEKISVESIDIGTVDKCELQEVVPITAISASLISGDSEQPNLFSATNVPNSSDAELLTESPQVNAIELISTIQSSNPISVSKDVQANEGDTIIKITTISDIHEELSANDRDNITSSNILPEIDICEILEVSENLENVEAVKSSEESEKLNEIPTTEISQEDNSMPKTTQLIETVTADIENMELLSASSESETYIPSPIIEEIISRTEEAVEIENLNKATPDKTAVSEIIETNITAESVKEDSHFLVLLSDKEKSGELSDVNTVASSEIAKIPPVDFNAEVNEEKPEKPQPTKTEPETLDELNRTPAVECTEEFVSIPPPEFVNSQIFEDLKSHSSSDQIDQNIGFDLESAEQKIKVVEKLENDKSEESERASVLTESDSEVYFSIPHEEVELCTTAEQVKPATITEPFEKGNAKWVTDTIEPVPDAIETETSSSTGSSEVIKSDSEKANIEPSSNINDHENIELDNSAIEIADKVETTSASTNNTEETIIATKEQAQVSTIIDEPETFTSIESVTKENAVMNIEIRATPELCESARSEHSTDDENEETGIKTIQEYTFLDGEIVFPESEEIDLTENEQILKSSTTVDVITKIVSSTEEINLDSALNDTELIKSTLESEKFADVETNIDHKKIGNLVETSTAENNVSSKKNKQENEVTNITIPVLDDVPVPLEFSDATNSELVTDPCVDNEQNEELKSIKVVSCEISELSETNVTADIPVIENLEEVPKVTEIMNEISESRSQLNEEEAFVQPTDTTEIETVNIDADSSQQVVVANKILDPANNSTMESLSELINPAQTTSSLENSNVTENNEATELVRAPNEQLEIDELPVCSVNECVINEISSSTESNLVMDSELAESSSALHKESANLEVSQLNIPTEVITETPNLEDSVSIDADLVAIPEIVKISDMVVISEQNASTDVSSESNPSEDPESIQTVIKKEPLIDAHEILEQKKENNPKDVISDSGPDQTPTDSIISVGNDETLGKQTDVVTTKFKKEYSEIMVQTPTEEALIKSEVVAPEVIESMETNFDKTETEVTEVIKLPVDLTEKPISDILSEKCKIASVLSEISTEDSGDQNLKEKIPTPPIEEEPIKESVFDVAAVIDPPQDISEEIAFSDISISSIGIIPVPENFCKAPLENIGPPRNEIQINDRGPGIIENMIQNIEIQEVVSTVDAGSGIQVQTLDNTLISGSDRIIHRCPSPAMEVTEIDQGLAPEKHEVVEENSLKNEHLKLNSQAIVSLGDNKISSSVVKENIAIKKPVKNDENEESVEFEIKEQIVHDVQLEEYTKINEEEITNVGPEETAVEPLLENLLEESVTEIIEESICVKENNESSCSLENVEDLNNKDPPKPIETLPNPINCTEEIHDKSEILHCIELNTQSSNSGEELILESHKLILPGNNTNNSSSSLINEETINPSSLVDLVSEKLKGTGNSIIAIESRNSESSIKSSEDVSLSIVSAPEKIQSESIKKKLESTKKETEEPVSEKTETISPSISAIEEYCTFEEKVISTGSTETSTNAEVTDSSGKITNTPENNESTLNIEQILIKVHKNPSEFDPLGTQLDSQDEIVPTEIISQRNASLIVEVQEESHYIDDTLPKIQSNDEGNIKVAPEIPTVGENEIISDTFPEAQKIVNKSQNVDNQKSLSPAVEDNKLETHEIQAETFLSYVVAENETPIKSQTPTEISENSPSTEIHGLQKIKEILKENEPNLLNSTNTSTRHQEKSPLSISISAETEESIGSSSTDDTVVTVGQTSFEGQILDQSSTSPIMHKILSQNLDCQTVTKSLTISLSESIEDSISSSSSFHITNNTNGTAPDTDVTVSPTNPRSRSNSRDLSKLKTLKNTAFSKPLSDDDVDETLSHLLPGSIAEREHKKWYNAVEMPNNPYSKEALRNRLNSGGTIDKPIDIPNINSPLATSDEKLDSLECAEQKSLQVVLEADKPDYKRYGRDYYINDSKRASGTRKRVENLLETRLSYCSAEEYDNQPQPADEPNVTPDTTSPTIASREEVVHDKCYDDSADLFSARRIFVEESDPILDKATKVEFLSNSDHDVYLLPNEEISSIKSDISGNTDSLTPSEDSDIRVYDLNKQETKIIKNDKVNTINNITSEGIKSRPTVLSLTLKTTAPTKVPTPTTVGTPTKTVTPTRIVTPTLLKFLQPKRKIFDPQRIMSEDPNLSSPIFENRDVSSPVLTPTTPNGAPEKLPIEEDVVSALPSVRELAKAFLSNGSGRQNVPFIKPKASSWQSVDIQNGAQEESREPLSLQGPSNDSYVPPYNKTYTPILSPSPQPESCPVFVIPPEPLNEIPEDDEKPVEQHNHHNSNSIESEQAERPLERSVSPVLVPGLLKNNIAFFENLKKK